MPIKKEDATRKAMTILMTPAPPGSSCYDIMKMLEEVVTNLYQAGYDNGYSQAQGENIIKSVAKGDDGE